MLANNICLRTGRWLAAILLVLPTLSQILLISAQIVDIDGRNLTTVTFWDVHPCNENPCAYLVYVQSNASGPGTFGNLTSIVCRACAARDILW